MTFYMTDLPRVLRFIVDSTSILIIYVFITILQTMNMNDTFFLSHDSNNWCRHLIIQNFNVSI